MAAKVKMIWRQEKTGKVISQPTQRRRVEADTLKDMMSIRWQEKRSGSGISISKNAREGKMHFGGSYPSKPYGHGKRGRGWARERRPERTKRKEGSRRKKGKVWKKKPETTPYLLCHMKKMEKKNWCVMFYGGGRCI